MPKIRSRIQGIQVQGSPNPGILRGSFWLVLRGAVEPRPPWGRRPNHGAPSVEQRLNLLKSSPKSSPANVAELIQGSFRFFLNFLTSKNQLLPSIWALQGDESQAWGSSSHPPPAAPPPDSLEKQTGIMMHLSLSTGITRTILFGCPRDWPYTTTWDLLSSI